MQVINITKSDPYFLNKYETDLVCVSLFVGKEFAKDETQYVIFIFMGLNLGAYLIGRFQNFRGKPMFIYLAFPLAVLPLMDYLHRFLQSFS